jgi:hypothetical protein
VHSTIRLVTSAFGQSAIAGCVALLIAIQFIRPARTNPAVDLHQTLHAAATVPPAIQSILQRSCNDCHSDETRWPWYSAVAPVSWWVINDVNQGRRHLNFSRWLPPGSGDPAQYTRQRFYAICKSVQAHEMPIAAYTLTHPEAQLSSADIKAICDWGRSMAP